MLLLNLQICIGKSTWVFVAVLQLFAGYAYITHLVVIYAYLPELSNDPIELNRINSITNFFVYLGQFVFIVTAIVISFITGVDSIGQARISQVMVVAVGVIGYNYVWLRKMKSRPALQVMPEGASVLTIGFKKIRSTLWDLRHEYSPVLIFLCSIALAESATAAFVSIAVTYTTVVLEMEVKETGILIALVIFFGGEGGRREGGVDMCFLCAYVRVRVRVRVRVCERKRVRKRVQKRVQKPVRKCVRKPVRKRVVLLVLYFLTNQSHLPLAATSCQYREVSYSGKLPKLSVCTRAICMDCFIGGS